MPVSSDSTQVREGQTVTNKALTLTMNLVFPRFRGSKRQWLLKSWLSKETRQSKMTRSRKALTAISDPSPPCPRFETPCTEWAIWEHGAAARTLWAIWEHEAAARWWWSAQQLSYGSPKHCSEIFWVYVTNETADEISRDHVSPQWALTKIKDSLILPRQVHVYSYSYQQYKTVNKAWGCGV